MHTITVDGCTHVFTERDAMDAFKEACKYWGPSYQYDVLVNPSVDWLKERYAQAAKDCENEAAKLWSLT